MTPRWPVPLAWSAGPTLDEWYRALLDHKIVPTALAWPATGVRKTTWQEETATVSVGWEHNGERGSNATVGIRLTPAPKFGGWVPVTKTRAASAVPSVLRVAPTAVTFIQFPGRGTWVVAAQADGTMHAGTVFTLLHIARDLPIIRRRTRQLLAGEGCAPAKLTFTAMSQLPQILFGVHVAPISVRP